MTTTTAAGRTRSAVVVALVLGLAASAPVAAHPGEGQTPYRYVVAPPGSTSEGPPESGVSTQPIGPAGFAGTSDNQMQLTLPAGAFPPRPGERGVRVQLDQLDPATLPPLPDGLEPEGNAYRVGLTYAPSGAAVTALAVPATLGMSAPAAPTGVLRLVDGRWDRQEFTPVAGDAGFSSVVRVDGPVTLMQVYAPAEAPPSPPAAQPPVQGGPAVPSVVVVVSAAVVGAGLLLAARRRRPGARA